MSSDLTPLEGTCVPPHEMKVFKKLDEILEKLADFEKRFADHSEALADLIEADARRRSRELRGAGMSLWERVKAMDDPDYPPQKGVFIVCEQGIGRLLPVYPRALLVDIREAVQMVLDDGGFIVAWHIPGDGWVLTDETVDRIASDYGLE